MKLNNPLKYQTTTAPRLSNLVLYKSSNGDLVSWARKTTQYDGAGLKKNNKPKSPAPCSSGGVTAQEGHSSWGGVTGHRWHSSLARGGGHSLWGVTAHRVAQLTEGVTAHGREWGGHSSQGVIAHKVAQLTGDHSSWGVTTHGVLALHFFSEPYIL